MIVICEALKVIFYCKFSFEVLSIHIIKRMTSDLNVGWGSSNLYCNGQAIPIKKSECLIKSEGK